jgi:hypothetical protein
VVFHPVGKTGTDVGRPTGHVYCDGKSVIKTYTAGDGTVRQSKSCPLPMLGPSRRACK